MHTLTTSKHPETREGELFLTNSTHEDLHDIGWEYYRVGNVAYSKSGDVVEQLVPVFIREADVLRMGWNIAYEED